MLLRIKRTVLQDRLPMSVKRGFDSDDRCLLKELSREVSRQWRRGFDRDGHYVLKDQSHAHVREEGF